MKNDISRRLIIMTRRQKYFLKQKLIGLSVIILAVLTTVFGPKILGEAAGSFVLIFLFLGNILLFSKDMVWVDDYFREVEEKEERS